MNLEIGTPETFDAQLAQPGLVVAYFWGPECPNCEVFARDLRPIVAHGRLVSRGGRGRPLR